MKKTRILYSKYTDEEYLTESFKNTAPIEPNDNAVTDSEIFTGKLAGTFHGTYTEFEAGLNPLHRRGVDFTDVGNILAGIDAQEEKVTNDISNKRKELTASEDNESQSDDQN